MGFSGIVKPSSPTKPTFKGLSVDFLHKHGCQVCPLNRLPGTFNPHMQAVGSDNPLIYVLGPAPTKADDKTGEPFSRAIGDYIRDRIPEELHEEIRWNNVVRTWPQKPNPEQIEIECCFPAETQVDPIGQIKTSYRRWYNGPMVTVKTASGRVLTGTPNHPVFTSRGTLALNQVKVGDYAFRAGSADRTAGAPNRHNKPTSIGKVFSTLSEPRKMKRVRCTSFDFHGDGITDSDVNIVRTGSQLGRDFQFGAHAAQQFDKPTFTNTNPTFGLLVSSSALDAHFFVLTMIASSHDFFGCVCGVPIFNPPSGVTQDSGRIQDFTNSLHTNTQCSCDLLRTFPARVTYDDLLGRETAPTCLSPLSQTDLLPGSEHNTFSDQVFFNRSAISSSESSQCQDGSSIPVELDEIVSVETISDFRGHVYNLETGSNKYIANDLIVSNCKPSVIADIEATQPKAIFGIGPVPLKWALGESSIGQWNGRRVPVKIGSHTCWYFPMLDPDYIQWRTSIKVGEGRNLAFTFEADMKRALASLDDLPDPAVHTREQAIADIEIITGEGGWSDVDRVRKLLKRSWDSVNVGFDYETNGVRPYATAAKLLSFAMSTKSETFAVALKHKQAGWTPEQYVEVKRALIEYMRKAPARKISHNLPFELEWTGVKLAMDLIRTKTWGDSIGASYILDERPKTHDLGFMTLQYFGINIKLIDNLNKARLDDEPLPMVLRYNGLDARYHRLVYNEEVKDLKARNQWAAYQHQLRRAHAVVLTQIKGVPVNQTEVDIFAKQYKKEMRKQERLLAELPTIKRFRKVKGFDFRPSNTHDVKFIIQRMLKLSFETVDEEVLKQVKDPFADLTLKWRKASKLYSTYVRPYQAGVEKSNVWPDTLLHPILAITSTVTWRTSSNGPNIQNQPKRTAGKVIRRQVKPSGTKRVVAFDYAGIQARNVAMESKDRNLVKYFWEKYDVHTDWTNRLVKLYPKWITEGAKVLKEDKALFKAYRNRTKNEFVFPSFFGAIPSSVGNYLGIPLNIAEQLHGEFWEEFPDIKDWHERLFKQYKRDAYVTGLSGFRRHAPVSPNEIINSPIQGDESIIVLSAMCALSELGDMDLQPNIEIHDDLTFIWEVNDIEKNAKIVIREMIKPRFDWINVPLVVEMSVGKDWSALETVGEFSSADWDGTVRYTLENADPNGGTWADGTGWSNHKQNENATKKGRTA